MLSPSRHQAVRCVQQEAFCVASASATGEPECDEIRFISSSIQAKRKSSPTDSVPALEMEAEQRIEKQDSSLLERAIKLHEAAREVLAPEARQMHDKSSGGIVIASESETTKTGTDDASKAKGNEASTSDSSSDSEEEAPSLSCREPSEQCP